MTSSSRRHHNSGGERKSKSRAGMVQVKCSFCGNTFVESLASAVCPKCGRPANRPLPAKWRAIGLLIPIIGLGYAAKIRSHSPVAARQSFWISLLGFIVYGALYAFFR